jgi:hypothetical protein
LSSHQPSSSGDPSSQQAIELRGAVAVLAECQDREVLLVGPRGTAKTTGRLAQLLDLCHRYPGSRHLICRQTRASMTESTLVTLDRLLSQHPEASRQARTQRHGYNLWGSEIVALGLDEPAKCYGSEWDTVTVDEAIEASEDSWDSFGAVMRHNRMPYQQRVAITNPGPPGHWLNQRATPTPVGLKTGGEAMSFAEYLEIDRFNSGHQPGKMRRMISVFADNPAYWDADRWTWTDAGRGYVLGELANLSGHLRKRFFSGQWATASGAVYPEFDAEKHVIEPFEVPSHWPTWVGLDPGYDHPCAIVWLTIGPNERMYVCAESYAGGQSVEWHANTIRANNAGRTIRGYYADPRDAFAHRMQGSGKSIADQMHELGISFTPWPRAESAGVQAQVNQVRERLTRCGADGRPMLLVFESCPNTIREFQSWSYKRTPTGELPAGDDAFEDRDNHAMDVIRGLVATNPVYHQAKAVMVR